MLDEQPLQAMHLPDTTLYFVRHGESAANAGRLTMEHASIPLTALGRAQALIVSQQLPPYPARILTSEFVRARQTADPYCEKVARVAQAHPLLNEFSALDPAMLQGMTGVERRPIANAYWNAADPTARYGTVAETFFEFAARVGAFLNELAKLPTGSVLFGHGIWFGLLCWRLDGHRVANSADMKSFREFQRQMNMAQWFGLYLDSKPARSLVSERDEVCNKHLIEFAIRYAHDYHSQAGLDPNPKFSDLQTA